MRYIVAFYRESATTGGLYQPCGDRAWLFVDGRLSWTSAAAIASQEARQRGFSHYAMAKGTRLDDVDHALPIPA